MKLNGKICIIGVCFLMAKPLFSQNLFLELNLNSPVMQNMVRSMHPKPVLEMYRVIERAGSDKKIAGIILNVSSYHAEQDTLWDLRSALEKFKSKGKKICAFIGSADLDLYCLATVADKIVMDDVGILTMLGYSWGRSYIMHSLEKLGIGTRELRYLEYKSGAESYTRDSMSDADRRQYGEILDTVYSLTREKVTRARSWTEEEFDTVLNEEFMFSAKSALARGLVDRIGRKEAVLETVREMAGDSEFDSFYLYGETESSLTESKYIYGPPRAGSLFKKPPRIAVIYAGGMTDMERGIAALNLAQTIKEVSEKKRIKAIVLRISSPGGSAEAADYVAEAIKAAKKKIPVVVSMGSVAASGGYWASMSANHIVASPVTLTGSIGVIGTWFYDKGLNSKLGLTVDSMQRGNHADLMTGVILPRRDLSEAEEARYREYILDMYGGFVARVAENRKMDIEKVESLAQGRVYSGIAAFNAGLVDSLGGLDDAVRIARNLAEIPDDIKVAYREYPKPKFFEKMLDRIVSGMIFSGRAKTSAADTASFAANLFFPQPSAAGPLLDELGYRISHNGQVMPVLPLESGINAGWQAK